MGISSKEGTTQEDFPLPIEQQGVEHLLRSIPSGTDMGCKKKKIMTAQELGKVAYFHGSYLKTWLKKTLKSEKKRNPSDHREQKRELMLFKYCNRVLQVESFTGPPLTRFDLKFNCRSVKRVSLNFSLVQSYVLFVLFLIFNFGCYICEIVFVHNLRQVFNLLHVEWEVTRREGGFLIEKRKKLVGAGLTVEN